MTLPFIEEKIGDNLFIRTFNQSTDSSELLWHQDQEDRIVEPIGQTDWGFQLDNQLPQKISGKLFIPKMVYHRIIKGTGDLKIKLEKIHTELGSKGL
jgi:hypothetical protein